MGDINRPSQRRWIRTGYAISLFFVAVTPTAAYIKGTVPEPGFYYYPKWGPLFFPYAAFYAVYIARAFRLLFEGSFIQDHAMENQRRIILSAYLICFAGGLQTFLLGMGLPMWRYALYMVPLGLSIVCYALLTNRLLDFQLVIRKTLIYSTVTALLSMIYVAIVVLPAWFFQGMIHSPGAWTYAAAACVVALLFHPLRMIVQRWIDRRFFREIIDREFLQELTSGFIHELKRPLTHISLPAELCLAKLDDISAEKVTLQESLQGLRQHLRYILNLSLEAGHRIEAVSELNVPSNAPMESVDLPEMLIKVLEMEQVIFQKSHVTVSVDVPAKLPPVQGHPKQLELVFMNLIKNALEAMESCTGVKELRVSAKKKEDQISVSICDSGVGIQQEHLASIFEPYFSTKSGRGMGMGLYLSKQVIKAHGGSISASNAEGRGAEFRVELPIVSISRG